MMYEEKFSRNLPTLTRFQQKKIRGSVFCVLGLGGTGGFALECLVRSGVENLILFDHDRFELTNFNRQLLATDRTLDRKKTDAAAERARSINEKVKIRKFGEFDPKGISDADVMIDATDSLAAKLEAARACRRKKIPYFFCSAEGSRGMVSVFTGYRFEKAFQVDKAKAGSRSREQSPRALNELRSSRSCASILCPAASIAGSLAASQAINQVLGKPVVRAPNAMFIDIFDERLFWKARLG